MNIRQYFYLALFYPKTEQGWLLTWGREEHRGYPEFLRWFSALSVHSVQQHVCKVVFNCDFTDKNPGWTDQTLEITLLSRENWILIQAQLSPKPGSSHTPHT